MEPAIFLMGPTASGKTGLAVALAQYLPCEIISVDSALVYRSMDIGTAKPDAETLARVPHWLIDICDPADSYSAARFRADAQVAMAKIRAKGKIPLLTGGTGLYFRALERGLSALPPADPALRARLNEDAQRLGWVALHDRLAELDPASAARIHPHDPQRIQRALEVCLLAGQPMSQLLQQERQASPVCTAVKLVIAPTDRNALRQRIRERFSAMLARGLLEEVRALRARGDLHLALPSMRAVGYRQVWQHLDGQLDFATMAEQAIIATGQLAKRQLTWLRAEPDAHWLDALDNRLLPQALAYLRAAGAITD